ncbi:hypothetical protein CEXT_789311 [Caerostris extrusa]|uniref:Uncharacterized protein n=1 Tax=Caerostris extrusa TaxID=172846 RepID=A0AAV4VWT7_CAEEX|nr:hypothetical protein CEXT_789311 [Caerostris extrusa]
MVEKARTKYLINNSGGVLHVQRKELHLRLRGGVMSNVNTSRGKFGCFSLLNCICWDQVARRILSPSNWVGTWSYVTNYFKELVDFLIFMAFDNLFYARVVAD